MLTSSSVTIFYCCFLLVVVIQLCALALLLFANVIRHRQSYSSFLAPLAQSELLIYFSVCMTFVKAQHPRLVFLKNHSAGQ